MARFEHFTAFELSCRCGCGLGEADMDQHFMDKVVRLRKGLGFPLAVSSAIRCSKHNKAVSSTGLNGPHTTGRAVDVLVFHDRAYELLRHALARAEFTGIGVKQNGSHSGRFIHLDDLEAGPGMVRPAVWSY